VEKRGENRKKWQAGTKEGKRSMSHRDEPGSLSLAKGKGGDGEG
jgi:hypothetical protein